MLRSLEDFLKGYPNIIAALSAFGTLAAVIISLWLSYSSRYSKVTAHTEFKKTSLNTHLLDGSTLLSRDINDWHDVISVTITNHGPYTIFLNYLGSLWWRFSIGNILLTKKSLMHNPLYPLAPPNQEFEIQAGKTLTILLTNDANKFLNQIKQDRILGNKFLTILRLNFIQFQIITNGGQLIKSTIGRELKKFISEHSEEPINKKTAG